jgi:hypothetical protein
MNLNNNELLQAKCEHSYGSWFPSGKTDSKTLLYKCVCPLCMHVFTYSGDTAPDGFNVLEELAPIGHDDKLELMDSVRFELLYAQKYGLKVVYVAGKVTGLPKDEVDSKFIRKTIELRNQAFAVLNPCAYIKNDEDWQVAMRKAFILLMLSDYICLLPDWQLSEGAKLEAAMAAKLGISVIEG